MRACDARTPCRAGCDRSTPYEKALHQREASLPRCKTLLRSAKADGRSLVAISEPRESELKKTERKLMQR